MPELAVGIKDEAANKEFCALALKLGFDPNAKWMGKYVEQILDRERYLIEAYAGSIKGEQVLEFGCNVGASAIVMAALGADVTAIDINASYIELAKLNAQRYGLKGRIKFILVPDTSQMPFADKSFGFVNCSSVLEYVGPSLLPKVKQEIDRITKLGGVVLITGTSNRLWPQEIHSRQWLTNYIPRSFDKAFRLKKSLRRGVFPWDLYFKGYKNLDLINSDKYLKAKRISLQDRRYPVLNGLSRTLNIFSLSLGLFAPCVFLPLRKPD